MSKINTLNIRIIPENICSSQSVFSSFLISVQASVLSSVFSGAVSGAVSGVVCMCGPAKWLVSITGVTSDPLYILFQIFISHSNDIHQH